MSDFEELIGITLELPVDQVTDELGPANFGGWTSLRHVQLIAAVQRRYEVRLTPKEVRAVHTVGGLRRAIADKGVTP